ncbi:MAG: hypothetical protein AABZ53_15355 [Planctomycetota bacterium]
MPRNDQSRAATLARWVEYRGRLRIKDERVRAIVLRLCEGMIAWLEGRAEAPESKDIVAALKCKPTDAVFFGATALADLGRFDRERWGTIKSVFWKASVRACVEILTYCREPAALATMLIENAIEHPSAEVRRRAIERAYWGEEPSFLSLLERASAGPDAAIDANEVTRYRSLLENGYHAVFRKDSWSWSIEYRDEGSMRSADVPRAVVERIGLKATMKHVRKHHNDDSHVAWDDVLDDLPPQ